jgi:hypothetical protein
MRQRRLGRVEKPKLKLNLHLLKHRLQIIVEELKLDKYIKWTKAQTL